MTSQQPMFQIPNTEYAAQPTAEVFEDIETSRNFEPTEIGMARQAVISSFGEFNANPEEAAKIQTIARITAELDANRKSDFTLAA
jgi:hypothetical protein